MIYFCCLVDGTASRRSSDSTIDTIMHLAQKYKATSSNWGSKPPQSKLCKDKNSKYEQSNDEAWKTILQKEGSPETKKIGNKTCTWYNHYMACTVHKPKIANWARIEQQGSSRSKQQCKMMIQQANQTIKSRLKALMASI